MKRAILSLLCCLLTITLWGNRYIATGEIKVMAEKDANSKVLGRIQNHGEIEVTGISNNWWKINYNGKDAYILGKHLKQAGRAGDLIDLNDPDTIFIIIGSVLVIFVILGGTQRQLAARYPKPGSSQLSKVKSQFSYWYQCLNCNAYIKNSAEPRTAGCTQAQAHSWINLGEAGDVKYLCKKCSTFVAMKSEPGEEGCLRGGTHEWRKF